jgi:PrtD family type I secretion system ABC transporter
VLGQQGMKKQVHKLSPLQESLFACKVMFRYALLLGCIINLLMLAPPLYSMQVLDRVLSSGNLNTLVMLTLVICLALALLSLLQGARSFAMTQMGNWLEHRLSEVIFRNSIQMALDVRGAAGSQKFRDLQTVKNYLTSPQLLSILDIPWALIFIIVLFVLHWMIGSLALAGGIILLAFGLMTDKYLKPLLDKNNDTFMLSMRQIDQATRNAEVVSVMGLIPNIIKKWHNINEGIQRTHSLTNKRQAVFTETTKFIRLVLQIAVTGVGAYLVIHKEITPGMIIASSALVGRALAPFEQAITSWKMFINCRKSYHRLQEQLQQYPLPETKMQLPAPEGTITLEKVHYAPKGAQKYIVQNADFEIPAGTSLAIIGPSGSGKTTLAKLIVGAYAPTIGKVRIDGSEINHWNREDLGQHIGYLPQDVELFSGTIKENIARMEPEPDNEKVVQAAQIAGVHDMIVNLPNGYDTQIGPDGSVLSGGQRQRIGLARSLYNNPRILVLDEPNSNLDSQGEEALNLAIEVAKEQKITTIIISHRPNILNIVENVMIITQGRIVQYGPRDKVSKAINSKSVTDAI